VLLTTLGWVLRPHLLPGDRQAHDDLTEMEEAAQRMNRLVRDFLVAATSRSGDLVALQAAPLEVPPLVDSLRRRLQAQVLGKDIRVSVFASREAPAQILCDPLLFDRVVDNLLTNAARYTRQGSIVVDLSGTSDGLAVKISDTGEGLGDDELRLVFRPGETGRAGQEDSHGLGLSIVVRLLDQVGGRLEVLSRPGMGTTFWAHFPLAPRPEGDRAPGGRDTLEDAIDRVVTIRAAND
jgi:signal transduction histidine kinase